MLQPAACIGDMTVCPLVSGTVPHVGGPIVPMGQRTVLIGGRPAATVGDMATCAGPPATLAMGSPTVVINGKPAIRVGDMTNHGGTVAGPGVQNVLIG